MRSSWLPTLTMMMVSLISYVDRNTLALLSPTILKECGLSVEQYGYIISAFSTAYMLGNPFWGWVLDRVGVRRGMVTAVALWTTASVSHAFAGGFLSFASARALLGFGEGATFPGALRTVMQTLSEEKRSRGIAVAYSGGSLGAIVTPWIITPISAMVGWRGAFWFTGVIGLAWIGWWLFLSRRPEIRAVAPVVASKGQPLNFRDSRVWAFMACYALGGLPLAFILYNAALYLGRVHGKSQAELGWVLWIPPLGWELGYYAWGWIQDKLPSGRGFLPAQRRMLGVATVLTFPLALLPHVDSYALVLFLMFFGMFVAGAFIIGAMSYVTRTFSVHNSGFIAGIGAGSWGAVVALLSPFFGRLFDLKNYSLAFAIAAAIPVAGYLLWLLLDRVHRADPPHTEASSAPASLG